MEKKYDVEIGRQVRWGIDESEVAVLFGLGQIHRDTSCRAQGAVRWMTIDDCLPLLKYGVDAYSRRERKGEAPRPRPMTNSIRLVLLLVVLALAAIGAGMAVISNWNTPASVSARFDRVNRPWPRELVTSPENSAKSFDPSTPVPLRKISRNTFQQSASVQPYIAPAKRRIEEADYQQPAIAPRRAQPAPRPQTPYEEFTFPLGIDNWVRTKYGSFGLKVIDHGPVTISVWINRSGPRKIEKEKGYERTGTNIVQIHRLPNAKVYYVDRIAVSSGNFVIRVTPDE